VVVEESRAATADDDLFHFISYVPVAGCLYELDGLKEGPVNLGTLPAGGGPDAWLALATPAIQERIERYSASEVRFNLMAVVRAREDVAAEELAACAARREEIQRRRAGAAGGAMEEDWEAQLAAVDEDAARAGGRLAAAREQSARWAAENARRKHNFVPFIFQFLKTLAETPGALKPLFEKAKEKAKAKQAAGGR